VRLLRWHQASILHTLSAHLYHEVGMLRILEILIVIVLLAWVLGAFVVPVGGNLIHLLLVVLLVIILIRVLTGRGPRL
jgi:hypothetical protein